MVQHETGQGGASNDVADAEMDRAHLLAEAVMKIGGEAPPSAT